MLHLSKFYFMAKHQEMHFPRRTPKGASDGRGEIRLHTGTPCLMNESIETPAHRLTENLTAESLPMWTRFGNLALESRTMPCEYRELALRYSSRRPSVVQCIVTVCPYLFPKRSHLSIDPEVKTKSSFYCYLT